MYLFHVMHVGLWEITIQNYNVEQTERLSLTDSASSLPAITPMHNQNMLAFTVMLKVLESQYYKYHTVCVCARIFFSQCSYFVITHLIHWLYLLIMWRVSSGRLYTVCRLLTQSENGHSRALSRASQQPVILVFFKIFIWI